MPCGHVLRLREVLFQHEHRGLGGCRAAQEVGPPGHLAAFCRLETGATWTEKASGASFQVCYLVFFGVNLNMASLETITPVVAQRLYGWGPCLHPAQCAFRVPRSSSGAGFCVVLEPKQYGTGPKSM